MENTNTPNTSRGTFDNIDYKIMELAKYDFIISIILGILTFMPIK